MRINKVLLCGLIAYSTNMAAQTAPVFKPFATQFKTAETVNTKSVIRKGITNADPDDFKTLSAPTNIKLVDLLTSVRMTWDALTADALKGETIDPAKVKYTIYKIKENEDNEEVETDNDWEYEGEVTGETQYDIQTNTDEGEPWVTTFGLIAEYDKYKSGMAISAFLPVGKAYSLPFTDSFKNAGTENFWWADCNNSDDYGLLTDASLKSADGDNGCFGFMASKAGETCSLVSHKISLAGSENPVVSFSQYFNVNGDVPLTLEVMKPDGTVEAVDTKNISNLTTSGWKTMNAALAKFANERYIVLHFRFTASTPKILTGIDNICIRDEKNNDLAVSISAPKKVTKGQKLKLAVEVDNLTEKASPTFTLTVDINGKVMKKTEKSGVLKGYKKKSYDVEYTTSAIDAAIENLPINVELTADGDENTDNNTAQATVATETTWRNGVENLNIAMDGNDAYLTWMEPKANAKTVVDGFEDYSPWATAFGEWTLVDVDKATSGGVFPNSDYPHEGEPLAFIVMNPSDIGETLEAHSGNQFLGAPYPFYVASTETYYPNADEWLISPELSGKEQTVKFWAKNLRTKDYNGNWMDNDEIFYFLGSKTDTDLKSFTDYYSYGITHKFDVYGGDWTEFSVKIAEGTKFFGIHHTTPGTEGLMLMLDDFTFEQGGTAKKYNVYRDGTLIGCYSGTACTVKHNDGGEHTFAVTAVYADGSESAPVYVSGTAGISDITKESSRNNGMAFTVNGMRTGNISGKLKPGLYILNGKKIVIK